MGAKKAHQLHSQCIACPSGMCYHGSIHSWGRRRFSGSFSAFLQKRYCASGSPVVSYDTGLEPYFMPEGGDCLGDQMLIAFVQPVLARLADCIKHQRYYIDPRPKNLALLADPYGFTIDDLEAILLQLTPQECLKHEADRDDPGSPAYWFFKTKYEGFVIYIKFKLIFLKDPDGKDFAYIKSLHEDE